MTPGWLMKHWDELDLTAGRGIAAPPGELALGINPTGDYLEVIVLSDERLEVGHFGSH